MKNVLIVENCTKPLTVVSKEKIGHYVLKGVFTELDGELYNDENFLIHIADFLERKKEIGVVYGEFDKSVFDLSSSSVSHTIEKLNCVTEHNGIEGEIRTLNTYNGKMLQACIDEELPIFMQSISIGKIDNNNLTIEKLLTYNCTPYPGEFPIKDYINESLGFSDKSNFRIYDITQDEEKKTTFKVDYDDNQIDVINSISSKLKDFGLTIDEIDGGNGFVEYQIKKV